MGAKLNLTSLVLMTLVLIGAESLTVPQAVARLRAELARDSTDLAQIEALQKIRTQLAYPPGTAPVAFVAPWLSPRGAVGLGLVAAVGVGLGVAARRPLLTGLSGAGWLVCALGSVPVEVEPAPVAILAQAQIPRAGNGISYPARLAAPLPAGAEVERRTVRGGWVQIAWPNGTGWVPETALVPLESHHE